MLKTIYNKMDNRLQFRHHTPIFETREEAIEYIQSRIRFTDEGLAFEDAKYGYSLFAEPTVLRYKNVTETDPEGTDDPHLILVIGSVTNEEGVETGHAQYGDNRFCIIDIDKTEQEIADLQAELEAAIRSLTLVALNSDTLNFYADKTEDGTIVSGDVKTAPSYIYEDIRRENNLMVTPNGLFMYAKLEYNEAEETFTFTVSKSDGTLDKTLIQLPNNHVIRGYYSKRDESIHLVMKQGDDIVIDCEQLIGEWGVEGDASRTPVVLTREEIDYDHTDDHHHVEPWQDVLRADVRLKDEQKVLQEDGTYKYVKDANSTNILSRTSDGRYLYVDGKASNIIYYVNGQKSTVKNALDALSNIKLSSDNDNILIEKTDGFFASTKLQYVSKENKLIFKASGQEDTIINLNGFKLFENIYYDPTNEALVITYIDGNDKVQIVTVPIGEMIRDWEWEPQNIGHNVSLTKKRNVTGNDKVSADVNIFEGHNNILVDTNHSLYVRGEADNIKYGEDSNVKNALDTLFENDVDLDAKIDHEIERAQGAENTLDVKIEAETERATRAENTLDAKINQETADRIASVGEERSRAEAAETKLDNKIGTGFTDDPHENVTYKFEQLQNQVNANGDAIQNEVERSTAKDNEHDEKLQTIEGEIGDGFNPRNTVRDEIDALQGEIDELSANTEGRLSDIVNNDHSIDVDKTDPVVPVIKVNLSTEVEDGKPNIIKLNSDGLYAGVDLDYQFNTEVGTNKLIFKTTNGTKTFDLQTNSVVDKIYYDPAREAIIIEYTVNGHRMPDVVVPVADLIDEWRVWDGHEGAIQLEKDRIPSGTTQQDVLKASVVISDTHTDNILTNDNGALYVSGQGIIDNRNDIDALKDRMDAVEDSIDGIEDGIVEERTRAMSAETALNSLITNEITRSTTEDQRMSTALDSEISRSIAKDDELTTAIGNETTERITADAGLQTALSTERSERVSKDSDLESAINTEVSRATAKEQVLETTLTSEITRSTAEDTRLNNLITAETAARVADVQRLESAVSAASLTFDDTESIDFNNPSSENNVVRANVKLQEGENIIKLGEGLYASVSLSYDPARNTIKLVTSNGEQEAIQLNTVGSLIDGIEYDAVNRALVIRYHDAAGHDLSTSFPVNELFNDWIVQNPSEKSAVELTKVINSGDEADVLSGRILITDDHNGDGKPDQGSDNMIEIRNNGLYVNGTIASGAAETAECAMAELKVVENNILGMPLTGECGNGDTYRPNTNTNYIFSGTSFNNVDVILDNEIKNVSDEVEELEQKVLNMWASGESPTTISSWQDVDDKKVSKVDVKLSHGNTSNMSDRELTTSDASGDYIDPTRTEFTDTNALRIVSLQGSPVNANQNGLYLSNVWDCGLYFSPSDTAAQQAAANAGYKTDYYTDEASDKCNYNYMNNVRQHDI